MIYFLQQDDHGPIKIGKTDDVQSRIKTLQNASPYNLNLLKTIPGNNERKYHFQFKRYRIKGEWFEPSKELLEFIRNDFSINTESAQTTSQSKLKECLISEILKCSKLTLVTTVNIILRLQSKPVEQLAKEVNVSRQMIHSVLSGKKESKKVKKAITKALGFNPWA